MAKPYHNYLLQQGVSTENIACIDKLYDLSQRALWQNRIIFSEFVNPEIRVMTLKAFADSESIVSFGGYTDAEYQLLAFGVNNGKSIEFPITLIHLTYPSKFSQIRHRDLLGALMSLGLRRSAFGDIVIADDSAYFFVLTELADYVLNNLTKVKNVGIKLKAVALSEFAIAANDLHICNLSLASLRADLVLAAAFKLSRAQAQNKIRSGLVKYNYLTLKTNTINLGVGDMISLRGRGRFYLTKIIGQTKKGKFRVEGKITKV